MAKRIEDLEPQDRAVVEAFQSCEKNPQRLNAIFSPLDLHFDQIVECVGDVNKINADGRTLLGLAVLHSPKTPVPGSSDLYTRTLTHVSTLLKMGATPLADQNTLRPAIYHPEMLPILLAHVPEGDAKAHMCSGLLREAIGGGYASSTTKILLDNGANPNFRYEDGFTVMHYVATDGNLHSDALELLISRGGRMDLRADPSLSDISGKTPMDIYERHHPGKVKASEFDDCGSLGHKLNSTPNYNKELENLIARNHKVCKYILANADFLKGTILHSVLYKDSAALKILIKSGRLIISPTSLGDTEVEILARNVAEVARDTPLSPLIDEGNIHIAFNGSPGSVFAGREGIKPPPEEMARMKPIIDAMNIDDPEKRAAVHDELVKTFRNVRTQNIDPAPDSVLDLISQYTGMPGADKSHMERINAERLSAAVASSSASDSASTLPSHAAATTTSSTTMSEAELSEYDRRFAVIRDASGKVIGSTSEPIDQDFTDAITEAGSALAAAVVPQSKVNGLSAMFDAKAVAAPSSVGSSKKDGDRTRRG